MIITARHHPRRPGRPVDVDDRDDLHDRGPGEVRRAQHLQRDILVLLPG